MAPLRMVSVAATVGAILGFGIELVFQPVVHHRDVAMTGVELPFPWLNAVLAPFLTAALAGAAGGVVALPLSLLFRGRARGLSHALIGLSLSLALVLHVMGLAVRFTSGLYPGPSAAKLLFESPIQFLDQARESYPLGLEWLAAGFACAWAMISVALILGSRRSASWGPRRLLFAPVTSLVGVALLAAPPISLALRDHAVETTETSLYVAVLDASAEEDEVEPTAQSAALDGPPRSEREAYMAMLAEQTPGALRPFPNVLLVVLESVPRSGTNFGGYAPRIVTPNLDRIAARSLRLARTWTTSTHSNYAQMAILSSLFPRRGSRLDTYTRIDYPRSLPQDLLRPLGYDTATFSSQNEDWQGMRRFQTTRTPHHFFASHSYTGPKMDSWATSKIPDDTTVGAAIEWLARPRSAPFYMYLNLQQTHWSYRLPRGVRPRFEASSFEELREQGFELSYMRISPDARDSVRVAYDSALYFVDAQVGRLFDALEAKGQLDDTIVIITADHGESFGEAGVVTHGKTLREPEARPPLLVYYPREVEAREVETPVSHLDVMPTVLDLLGLPPFPGYQGRSFIDEQAIARERRAVFLTMQGLRHADGVVCYPWKLVNDRSRRRVELYHLGRDPGERRNLVSLRSNIARRLESVLAAQIDAQLGYHARYRRRVETRLAPRVARCPDLPPR